MFRKINLASRLAVVTPALVSFTQLQQQQRGCATVGGNNNNNNAPSNNNNRRRTRGNRQRSNYRRALLPPAFDVVHWNDEDVTKGYLLRFLHRDSFIVLDYHRQKMKMADPAGTAAPAAEEDAEEGNDNTTNTNNKVRRSERSERAVTVTLPPVFIARFLGVLEGRLPSVEVQSRFTNATFKPNAEKGKHHFTLHCVSTKPTSGQQLAADGSDVQEESIEWTVDLDVAESLMLERFLTQALHYNTGFARHIF